MSNIGLTEAIRKALARPDGLLTKQLHGYDHIQVGQRVCHMCDKLNPPQAFRAKLSHRSCVFFDTEARAKAYQAKHAKPKKQRKMSQKAVKIANNLAVGKKLDEARENLRASNRSGYELSEADRAKITVLEGFNETKGRYYVAPESVPVFRYGGL